MNGLELYKLLDKYTTKELEEMNVFFEVDEDSAECVTFLKYLVITEPKVDNEGDLILNRAV